MQLFAEGNGLPVLTPASLRIAGRAGALQIVQRRCRGGGGLWADPAEADPRMRRTSAASISTPRFCRAGAAPRRSSAPSWPAMPRPASPSCAWMRGSTPAPSASPSAPRSRPPKPRANCTIDLAALGAGLMVQGARAISPRARSPAGPSTKRASPMPPRSSRPTRASTGHGRQTKCSIKSKVCRPIPAPGSRWSSPASASASAPSARPSPKARADPARCSTTSSPSPAARARCA